MAEGGIDEEMVISMGDKNYRFDIYCMWLSFLRSQKNGSKEEFLKYRGFSNQKLDEIILEFENNKPLGNEYTK